MRFNSQYFTLGAFAVVAGLLWFYYSEYQEKAKDYGDLNDKYLKQVIAINQQQERIQKLTELDKTHTQELANAKTEIDTLRADVAAGRCKLRIKATCPVHESTISSSLGDGIPVELTGETGSTVLDIREGIINDQAKLRYLQDYVKTEYRGNYGK
ncbi:prophage endopeptidase [Xenorhabdus cabanillasii]|uniref:Prophage endopeptidase n=1 Tax=Xenorhabdus cabanillasii TaxID=351673 RepID=A0A3D9UDZ8_9GAMM|nr:lysis protein [Xenorhabdus cabanillasii]REF27619.1 prophage endopeptidase [Xenorhabdus cabanillasii]